MRELRYLCSNRNLFFFLSLRMVCIGAEQMLGMADIKDNRQLIVIQITHTENLNQNDPAPELVSTLTDPHPGQRKWFFYVLRHYYPTSALFLL